MAQIHNLSLFLTSLQEPRLHVQHPQLCQSLSHFLPYILLILVLYSLQDYDYWQCTMSANNDRILKEDYSDNFLFYHGNYTAILYDIYLWSGWLQSFCCYGCISLLKSIVNLDDSRVLHPESMRGIHYTNSWGPFYWHIQETMGIILDLVWKIQLHSLYLLLQKVASSQYMPLLVIFGLPFFYSKNQI